VPAETDGAAPTKCCRSACPGCICRGSLRETASCCPRPADPLPAEAAGVARCAGALAPAPARRCGGALGGGRGPPSLLLCWGSGSGSGSGVGCKRRGGRGGITTDRSAQVQQAGCSWFQQAGCGWFIASMVMDSTRVRGRGPRAAACAPSAQPTATRRQPAAAAPNTCHGSNGAHCALLPCHSIPAPQTHQ
jgi:hypothetical protein